MKEIKAFTEQGVPENVMLIEGMLVISFIRI